MNTREEADIDTGLDAFDVDLKFGPRFCIALICGILFFPIVWCYDKYEDWKEKKKFRGGLRVR